MAEVLVQFSEPVLGSDRRTYCVQACGRAMLDGRWEGWLEFMPADGSAPLITGQETTQPNRSDLAYWATGLSVVYLEGALERTLEAGNAPTTPSSAPISPYASGPRTTTGPAPAVPSPRPVLDPFAVFAQGEDVLRHELRALSRDHLASIVQAYGLGAADAPAGDPERSAAELIAEIVTAVRRRLAPA